VLPGCTSWHWGVEMRAGRRIPLWSTGPFWRCRELLYQTSTIEQRLLDFYKYIIFITKSDYLSIKLNYLSSRSDSRPHRRIPWQPRSLSESKVHGLCVKVIIHLFLIQQLRQRPFDIPIPTASAFSRVYFNNPETRTGAIGASAAWELYRSPCLVSKIIHNIYHIWNVKKTTQSAKKRLTILAIHWTKAMPAMTNLVLVLGPMSPWRRRNE